MMTQEEKQAAEGVKRVTLELCHAFSHPIHDHLGQNLDALIAAGILSSKSVAFVRTNKIQFFGLNSTQVGQNARMLAVALTDSSPPCQIVGFSDGRVEFQSMTPPPNP